MARLVLAFLLMFGLSACDSANETPLSHAIAALRAGNRDDFLTAKKEAQEALNAAWQPGMDRCKLSAADFQKHGEAGLIDKLDHPELFGLSENARFVYTVKIAGKLDAAGKEIVDGPVVQSLFAYDPQGRPCPNADNFRNFAFVDELPGESDRRAVLKAWLDDLSTRIGADKFDAAMQNAVAELDAAGFSADWTPPQLQDDSNVPTFAQTLGQMKADGQGR